MRMIIFALLLAISYAQTERYVSELDEKIYMYSTQSFEAVKQFRSCETSEVTNIFKESITTIKYVLEETRHAMTSFLWGTGMIFFLMYIIPFSLMYNLSWKGRLTLAGLFMLYVTFDYHSQHSKAITIQSEGWSEPLHSYLGFMVVKYPTYMFGVTNSFWNDYIFSSTHYLIVVPLTYFSALLRSFRFNPSTGLFKFQEFSVVSDQHVVDFFFKLPSYRHSSFNEETNSWHVGSRGFTTVGSYTNIPGLNATITKDGNLTSINDREGNVITPECSSWGLSKQLFWDSMVMDIFLHWHIATHLQFSYVYGAQAVIPKGHALRKILDVHNRYHATTDFAAIQSPFSQVVTVNRPYNPDLGEFTTPSLGKSNATEWNYSPYALSKGRDDTHGYVYGAPMSGFEASSNIMHAASDHAASKTFPPAYARADSPQMHTPLGPYIKDQYECFHEFIADLSSEENWFDDPEVLKFFELSASVDESVAKNVHSRGDMEHFITMTIFESSFIHSLDHQQIYYAYEDFSSWSWFHRTAEEKFALPECNDNTPVKDALGTRSWLDWVKQYTILESFTEWKPWANLVSSKDDYMMETEYGFQELHQKRLRSRMRKCLRRNHESEKHREIVKLLRQDLQEFSSSIQF